MPRPGDSPDVAASKALAYILRHGAEKEGLHIRSDGYIKLNDVLARPKLRGVDKEMVFRLVEENAKKRFELFYGYDPSPPVPKGKGKGRGGSGNGNGGGKKTGKGKGEGGKGGRVVKNTARAAARAERRALASTEDQDAIQGTEGQAVSAEVKQGGLKGKGSAEQLEGAEEVASATVERVDPTSEEIPTGVTTATTAKQDIIVPPSHAATDTTVEDVSTRFGQTGIQPGRDPKAIQEREPEAESTELPLIPLPRPDQLDTASSDSSSTNTITTDTSRSPIPTSTSHATSADEGRGEYFIRASQGHSIALAGVAHLEPVLDDDEGRRRAGEMVHGTKWELWETLKETGLSRMARQHIHLAPSLFITSPGSTSSRLSEDDSSDSTAKPTLRASTDTDPDYASTNVVGPTITSSAATLLTAPGSSEPVSTTAPTTITITSSPATVTATPTPNRITPRPNATLLIYLDLASLLRAGIPVYTSANGVVLTPGNADGVVGREYWRKAERVRGGLNGGGEREVVWEGGKEVGGG